MKILIFLALTSCSLAATLSGEKIKQEWENFKVTNDRKYSDAKEEAFRKAIFEKTLAFVEEHNARYEKGFETFPLGITSLADFTEEELTRATSGSISENLSDLPLEGATDFSHLNISAIPAEVDWKAKGLMSKVKDQGSCGSSFAFSAIGSIEARLNIYNNKISPLLSEQQVLDCTPSGSCNGGYISDAFKYIIEKGGIDSNAAYKYEGKKNEKCRYNPNTVVCKLKDYKVTSKENVLAQLVANDGPVSAAIYISKNDYNTIFKNWKSNAIYKTDDCAKPITPKMLNHRIVVAGYGTENKTDFWLIKNSFGPNWGNEGYMRLLRNAMHCGIGLHVAYPILKT